MNYILYFYIYIDLLNVYTLIGVLKAVHPNESYERNRITKEVVAFRAGDFSKLVEMLHMDLSKPEGLQVKAIRFITFTTPLNTNMLHASRLNNIPKDTITYKNKPNTSEQCYFE